MRTVPLSIRNRLLSALPTADLRAILPLLELVTLRQGQILSEPNCTIQHVYFVEIGAACVFSRGKHCRPAIAALANLIPAYAGRAKRRSKIRPVSYKFRNSDLPREFLGTSKRVGSPSSAGR